MVRRGFGGAGGLLVAAVLGWIGWLVPRAEAQAPVRRQGPPPKAFASVELDVPVEVAMLAGEGVVVEVRLDGKGPYRFALDTGAAGGGRMSRALAESLALPVIGEMMAGDPSGKSRETVRIVEAGTLALGGATFHQVRLMVRDLPARPRRPNAEAAAANAPSAPSEIDGVLGFGLFQDHLLTLDYPGRRRGGRRAGGRRWPGEVVDYRDPFGIPQVRLGIGDLEFDADVDSGNMNGEVALPVAALERVPLAAEARVVGRGRTGFTEFEILQAPLRGSLRVGGHAVEGPRIDFVPFPHGNLGHAFLSRFVITIDQKNKRLRLRR